ncbi:unnamed protein product, partial [Prorocentrum cordatum]
MEHLAAAHPGRIAGRLSFRRCRCGPDEGAVRVDRCPGDLDRPRTQVVREAIPYLYPEKPQPDCQLHRGLEGIVTMLGDDGDICVEWVGTAATWVLQRHITRLLVADHLQKGVEGTVKRMHPSGDAFISWHGEGDKWILKDQFSHIAVRESLLASQ